MNDCYIVVDKNKDIVFSSDSAYSISTYMWGKSINDFYIYKAVRITSSELSGIKKELEER